MVARGVSRQSLYLWYRDRGVNGFPEVAGRIGRTDYWYEDEWTAWLESHLRERVGTLTQVSRGGDPDEMVDADEAARIMGYASGYVIHARRRDGAFPEPDDVRTGGRGRPTPVWRRSTVWVAADNRKPVGGRGRPGASGKPAKPHPYAGDPRLGAVLAILQSGAEPSSLRLAGEWGVSQRTAERVIRAARELSDT
jgi:predicted DNA-binding transcriptional regulator AlpA